MNAQSVVQVSDFVLSQSYIMYDFLAAQEYSTMLVSHDAVRSSTPLGSDRVLYCLLIRGLFLLRATGAMIRRGSHHNLILHLLWLRAWS